MRKIYQGLTIIGLMVLGGLVTIAGQELMRQGDVPSLAGPAEPETSTAVRYPVPPRPGQNIAASRPSSAPAAKHSRQETAKAVSPPAGSKSVYKWVDDQGTVHFSDREGSAKAKRIASVPVPTYDFPAAAKKEPAVVVRETPIVKAGFFPTQRFRNVKLANGLFLTGEGYRIEARPSHVGENLSFTGRVEGGAACDTLRVKGLLYSDAGKSIHLAGFASAVGLGTGTFQSESTRVGTDDQGWEVISVEASCQD